MKLLLKLLIRLYPAPWRHRYESEFDALLEDVKPTWRAAVDILYGGLVMQLKMLTAWKLVALTALSGLAVALSVSHEIRDQYVSSAVIRIQLAPAAEKPSSEIQTFVTGRLSDNSLTQIAERYQLYPQLRANGNPLAQMKKDIQIEPVKIAGSNNSSNGMMIQFRYYDRPLSKRVCLALVDVFMNPDSPTNIAPARMTSELIDPPNLPNGPIYPNRINLALTGVFGGILIGLSIALLRRTRKPA